MPCLNSPFPSGGDGDSWDGLRVLAHECSVGFSVCANQTGFASITKDAVIMLGGGGHASPHGLWQNGDGFAGERWKWDRSKFGVGRRKVATRLRAPRRRPGDSRRSSGGSGRRAAEQLNTLQMSPRPCGSQEQRVAGRSSDEQLQAFGNTLAFMTRRWRWL